MAKDVAILDQKNVVIPDHLKGFMGEEANIAEKQTTPSLAYEGKVWSISINGEKTKLTKKDDDGDDVPVPIMRVFLLDYAKERGRAYYEGVYDPKKVSQPTCWSDDGKAPHKSVKEPPNGARTCAECPMSAKGSKVDDNGKEMVACSQHRMLAVVPAGGMQLGALRLKIAVTSDWSDDPDNEAQGWFSFRKYTDALRARGIMHTAAIVTKMKFDQGVAYPKILFSPDKWTTPEQIAVVGPLSKADDTKKLIAGSWTPAGGDGVPTAEAFNKEHGPKGATMTTRKAPPKDVAPPDDDDDEEAKAAAETARKAAAKAKRIADAAAKAAADAEAEEEAEAAAIANAKGSGKAGGKPKAATVIDHDPDEPSVRPKAAVNIVDDDDDDDAAAALAAAAKAKPAGKADAKPKTEKEKAKPKVVEATGDDEDGLGDLLTAWKK